MKILKINFGRKDRLVPAKLIEIVNHCVKGKKVEIGRIELHDLFSLFEVDKMSAGRVVDTMSQFEIEGRQISVKYSDKVNKDRKETPSKNGKREKENKKKKRY